jgi:L-iditol 2-dehydrogenase
VKAAVLKGIRKVAIEERPVPEPGRGQVRIRITTVGVCGSDVHYYVQGKIGDQVIKGDHIPGHEFAGVIDKLGLGVNGPAVGTRVAVEPSINCGTCEQCQTGHPNQCPHVVFYGTPPVQGAYTEYVCHPAHLVFPVPDDVSDDDAAMLEPLGIGIHTVRRVRVDLGDTVAVFGCGPIGLVTLMSARAAGASRLIATDLIPGRLELARKLGADEVLAAKDADAVAWAMGLTHRRGVDAAFDCAGEQETVDNAMSCARIGGRVGLVGIPRVDRISYDPHKARRKELDVMNIRRSRFTVEAGLAMAKAKQIDLKQMVTHAFPLARIKEAFDLVDSYADGVVKAVIRVSTSS